MPETQGDAPLSTITRASYALEWLGTANLTKQQTAVFAILVRETFLRQRTYCWLAQRFLAEKTDRAGNHTSAAINDLVRMGVCRRVRRTVPWIKDRRLKTCFEMLPTFAVGAPEVAQDRDTMYPDSGTNISPDSGIQAMTEGTNVEEPMTLSSSLRSEETRAREDGAAEEVTANKKIMPIAFVPPASMPEPLPPSPIGAAPPLPTQRPLQASPANPDRDLIYGIPKDVHDAMFAIDPTDMAIHRKLPTITKLLHAFGHDQVLRALTWAKDNATYDAVSLAASVLHAGNTPWDAGGTATATSRTNLDTAPGSPEAKALVCKLLDVRTLLTLNEAPSVALKHAELLFAEQRHALTGLIPADQQDPFILACLDEIPNDRYWSQNLVKVEQLRKNFGTFSGKVFARMRGNSARAQQLSDIAAQNAEEERQLAVYKRSILRP